MKKIDVCLNVYGKPYQTIITLKSLLKYSGYLIDKIFITFEPNQPEPLDINFLEKEINYDKIFYHIPKYFLWINRSDINYFVSDTDYRLSFRYQYGIENTDKKYLFIIHNDVLFKSDILKSFLEKIEDYAGIGQIGQCWNCPMFYENKCNGDKFENFKPSYDEVIEDTMKYPESRTFIFRGSIDKENPMPLPECRLNEWCCLLDMEIYKKEIYPNGNVLPFGGYFKMDLGDEWFRQMVLKGYKFKNVDINEWCTHGYFSEINRGHPSALNNEIYVRDEGLAEKYYYNQNI
jgi:hypothetical protein